MNTMTKEEARSFFEGLGKSGDELKKLLTELVQKAEAKTEAEIMFPNDPAEGKPWPLENRFFYLLFEPPLMLLLSRAVQVLSEGMLKASVQISNKGNCIKLAIPD